MKNIFAVGTGPGAPEYLTLQAIKTLENADLIFAPNNKGKNMALDTVRDFIKNKKIFFLDFPMGNVSDKDYKIQAEKIINETKENSASVILTIGDPMIYSTFIYMMPYFKNPQINLQIVSGIPSAVAAAGRAKIPLAEKGEVFTITDHLDESVLNSSSSIALLKTFKQKNIILKEFEDNNFDYAYIKRATMDEESILTKNEKEKILEDENYISLIIARKQKGK
ncbi:MULTISPECIES: precorrin-2 C(20)-methyltransferase [unclassified Treponema]|uniref:precorrin-2 C(20)-methyltransferase n=1 Tax=unclassified Treponema TaxID=2638727 RepID=UPI0020A5E2C4|nr:MULTISPECIES: precorrin-2 C(20)-methyltransferase [unclassified Treponema]UTC67164.1 precorrin-2 C(20)-methyltransferase [Treponema sp. OMZ 789]UTC69894.1 precorrin-2 C(20)-methyltransferase [Treponema sp. OMZ 790]UTC72609.1 precorrin-2 C(20)-methyltransferase [Treponema sp. OMZ 791]